MSSNEKQGNQSKPGSGASNKKLEDLLACIKELLERVTITGSGLEQIGCIVEGQEKVGVVTACKKVDSEGNVVAIELWAFIPGSPPIQGYEGPWEICEEKQNLVNLENVCY